MFYLVQRLQSRNAPYSPANGFDAYFSLEYMGSSEFEWGAVPKALKSMRTRRIVVEPAEVTISGETRTVYFVGARGVSRNADRFEEWAAGTERGRPFYGKEWTHFDDVWEGRTEHVQTDAWWSLEDDIAWALNKSVAVLLADAFNARKGVSHD